jgi:serine/threonine protein phosphatase PrpC
MTAPGTGDGPLALVEIAQLSDTGRVRHHNEDRSLATADLLAVADGMGGAKAGEVAAQVAVDSVAGLSGDRGAEEVRAALVEANRAIRRMADDDPDKSGMGTTMTAAMLRDGRLDVVHVGDSRAYLWRDGELSQVTEDHSVVAELVRRGSITAEEAERHPHRNVITRALGAEDEVSTDVVTTDLRDGDVVLICSDGLSSYVNAAGIAEVLAASETLADAARGLVDRANESGGVDNVTVVLGRVGVAPRVDDTMEVPAITLAGGAAVPPPDEPARPTTEMRVLGGVHGHAGAERTGSAPAPSPKVLEPAGRRRSRVVPVLVGILVLLAVVLGGGAWVASRTYTLEEGTGGTVQVAHGLPFSVFGNDLSVDWQDTGVPASAVRQDQPGALSSTARGQGEAVELAARLVWRFSVTDPPAIAPPVTPGGGPAP